MQNINNQHQFNAFRTNSKIKQNKRTSTKEMERKQERVRIKEKKNE